MSTVCTQFYIEMWDDVLRDIMDAHEDAHDTIENEF